MKINRGLRLITNPNFMHYFLGKTLKMTVDVHCLAPPSIVTPESSNSWKSNEELPGALLSADRMTEIWEAWLTVKRMENGEWHAMPGNLNVLTYVRLGGSFWPVFFHEAWFFFTSLQVTHCKFSNRDQSFQLPQASKRNPRKSPKFVTAIYKSNCRTQKSPWKKSHILDHQAPCLSSTLEYTFFQGLCTTFLSHPI